MRVANVTRIVAALALTAGVAHAQLVGTFSGQGTVVASGAPGIGQPVNLSFGSSPLIAVAPLNGIFSPIATGTTGTVQSITVGTGAFNVPNFIQIAGYTFAINFVPPGTDSPVDCLNPVPAAGQTCSPPNTPFNLSNVDNGQGGLNVTWNFGVSGIVTVPSATKYAYTGTFNSTITNTSFQLFNNQIASGGTLPISYSLTIQATAIVATPEPATFALVGTGLAALAGVIRVRRSPV